MGKVAPLVEAFVQVNIILPTLMLLEYLINRLDLFGQVIRIRDVDIQDEISALCVETAAHDVTLEFLFLGKGCWVG